MIPVTDQLWPQVGLLLLAFALSTAVGVERRLRGHNGGPGTLAIVGTSSALFVMLGKYGFADVVSEQTSYDPSRVAASVVSGIGFLGAGLILTRRGAVVGLTTAASVWEVAAIGASAGAGLWSLALAVTVLHMVTTFGLRRLSRLLPGPHSHVLLDVSYDEGRGLLRAVLTSITGSGWTIRQVNQEHSATPGRQDERSATVTLELVGRHRVDTLTTSLSGMDGVRRVEIISSGDLE
ncbi:MgtC/SapB family protein [Corynebacterium sp. USCH3]|uniref:MgtC/SapB family protein n=1 Tax=Corynebacterium sp. USCH3 TaxID=3024840 RepID=UPI003094C52F